MASEMDIYWTKYYTIMIFGQHTIVLSNLDDIGRQNIGNI